jgi:hypothetical protein
VRGYYDALKAVGLPTEMIDGLVSEYHRLYWQVVLGEIGQSGEVWKKHMSAEPPMGDFVNMTPRSRNGRG